MACKRLFEEFDLELDESHIINGHVPVESKNGESPIKANGKILVIDGGFLGLTKNYWYSWIHFDIQF